MKTKQIKTLLKHLEVELLSAINKHPPMCSPHHGYAVIKEELDELWDEIKANGGKLMPARKEALQIAAMGLRYILDLCDDPDDKNPLIETNFNELLEKLAQAAFNEGRLFERKHGNLLA